MDTEALERLLARISALEVQLTALAVAAGPETRDRMIIALQNSLPALNQAAGSITADTLKERTEHVIKRLSEAALVDP